MLLLPLTVICKTEALERFPRWVQCAKKGTDSSTPGLEAIGINERDHSLSTSGEVDGPRHGLSIVVTTEVGTRRYHLIHYSENGASRLLTGPGCMGLR